MRNLFAALALAVALPATAALADNDCNVPADQRQSWEAVTQLANDLGWTINWMEIDDGCYELRVTDAGGNALKAKVDPATLEVVKARIKHFADQGAPAKPAN
ncbi:PepSY domain-containing protein [Paracoccus sp. (in: a-proteobacteria)]|uniref:PepSY domain-containing protein n=1 Tax=Paracoccus sp. TaxID=267 RepID=UPI00322002C7